MSAPEPSELPKLTERGLPGQILDAAWPKYGGNMNTVDFWESFTEGIEFTLSTLTAAGYTIAPPGSRVVPIGGVDAETVERCIALVRGSPVDPPTWTEDEALERAVDRLRALAEAKP